MKNGLLSSCCGDPVVAIVTIGRLMGSDKQGVVASGVHGWISK
jgi:hypothetical protein